MTDSSTPRPEQGPWSAAKYPADPEEPTGQAGYRSPIAAKNGASSRATSREIKHVLSVTPYSVPRRSP